MTVECPNCGGDVPPVREDGLYEDSALHRCADCGVLCQLSLDEDDSTHCDECDAEIGEAV